MRFVYTRRGGPLLDWSGVTPPYPTRAGETRSLGDFYPTSRTSGAVRRYGGPGDPRGAAIGYEHNRQLGAFYPNARSSAAVRRYGGRGPEHGGAAVGYEHERRLGYWGSDIGSGSGTGYRPAPGMGDLHIPLPGAPEVVEGYEDPAPGSAIVHLGEACTLDYAHRLSHGMGSYMPEGAARGYGQQMLGADPAPAPAPKTFDMGLVRKASAIASAYHGVKRNNGSVLWGLLWGIAGYIAPFYGLLVPAIGVAQGFGQAKVRSNPARTRRGRTFLKRAKRRMAARKARKVRTRKLPSRTRRKTKIYIRTRPRTKRGY